MGAVLVNRDAFVMQADAWRQTAPTGEPEHAGMGDDSPRRHGRDSGAGRWGECVSA